VVRRGQCRAQAPTALFAIRTHTLAPRGAALLIQDNDAARPVDASGARTFHNVSLGRHVERVSLCMAQKAILTKSTKKRNEAMPRYHFRVSWTMTHTGTLAVDAATPQVARRLAEQQLHTVWDRDPTEVSTLLENLETTYHLDVDYLRTP
jgi:hypothetical protein